MGNIYGCISHPLQEKIRKLLEMKYAKHIGISNKWVISKDKSISEDCLNNCGHISNEHSDYSVYFDMDVAAKIRHKEGTDNFDGLFLDFSVGLNRYGENSYSGNLDLTYCTCCEEPIEGESTYTEDGEVCSYCLGQYTFCYECERYYHENTTMFCIEDEHRYVCESCYDDGDYGFCEKTECYYSSNKLVELVEIDGAIVSVHEDYARENYDRCDVCRMYHEETLTNTDDDLYVCSKCLDEEYELIDGSYIFKSEQAA